MSNTLKFGSGNWATKEGSTLAYNDENNNFKPLPFDFERGSSATVVNKDGLIETVGSDMPRIDYKDDSEGALLLEPQRTNYVTQSNDFSGWFKSGAITVTSNYGVSPTGENNSTLLSFSGANNRLYLNTGAAYNNDSVSIYVKGNNGETISFDKSASIGSAKLFTLTGGWDRLESSYNSLSSSRVNIVISTNGGATATNIEVFGIQNEEGSYATSYIPTQGSAVTRLADVCNNGGNEQVINSTEGVLYAEFSLLSQDDIAERTIQLQGSAESCRIRFLNSGSLRWTLIGNDTTIARSLTLTNTNINKVAIRYNSASASIWINGSLADTADNGMTYTGLDELTFDGFHSKTKDVRVYNTSLTDAELIALTS